MSESVESVESVNSVESLTPEELADALYEAQEWVEAMAVCEAQELADIMDEAEVEALAEWLGYVVDATPLVWSRPWRPRVSNKTRRRALRMERDGKRAYELESARQAQAQAQAPVGA